MNPDIKQRWLTALRSGEYKQARNRLGTVAPDGAKAYCCLGVLCEITDQPKTWGGTSILYDGDIGFISESDMKFGLSVDDMGKLSNMNDTGDLFPQIADWIEQNL